MKINYYDEAYIIKQPKNILIADPNFYNENLENNEDYMFIYTKSQPVMYSILTIKRNVNSGLNKHDEIRIVLATTPTQLVNSINDISLPQRPFKFNWFKTESKNIELIIDNKSTSSTFFTKENKYYGFGLRYKNNDNLFLCLYSELEDLDEKNFTKNILSMVTIEAELDMYEFDKSQGHCINKALKKLQNY